VALLQRAQAAFGAESQTAGDAYLSELRTNWRDAEKDLRRTMVVALILAVTFELMTEGSGAEVTVFAVKVNKLSVLEQSIPVVSAYMAFAIVNLIVQSAALRTAHDAVMSVVHPAAFKEDFEHFLVPGNATFYSQQPTRALKRTTTRHGDLAYAVELARVTSIAVAPVLFVVYAYVRLWYTNHLGALVWVGFGISVVFITLSVCLAVTAVREGDFRVSST
jgi:hypothetical protein